MFLYIYGKRSGQKLNIKETDTVTEILYSLISKKFLEFSCSTYTMACPIPSSHL